MNAVWCERPREFLAGYLTGLVHSDKILWNQDCDLSDQDISPFGRQLPCSGDTCFQVCQIMQGFVTHAVSVPDHNELHARLKHESNFPHHSSTYRMRWSYFLLFCHTWKPGGGELFRIRPDRPWGPPSLLYNGYRVFPWCKAAGTWRWPPTPSSAEVQEKLKPYIYSPFGSSWPVLGWTSPLIFVTREVRKSKNKIRITSGLSRTQELLQGKRARSTRNTKSRQK